MKSVAAWLCLTVAVVGWLGFLSPLPVRAQANQLENQEQIAPQPPPRPHTRATMVAFTPGMESVFWRACKTMKCIGLVLFAIHIMLAVWVFLDIRRRGDGHGIFVALALLGGIPATILYALVRLGDIKRA